MRIVETLNSYFNPLTPGDRAGKTIRLAVAMAAIAALNYAYSKLSYKVRIFTAVVIGVTAIAIYYARKRCQIQETKPLISKTLIEVVKENKNSICEKMCGLIEEMCPISEIQQIKVFVSIQSGEEIIHKQFTVTNKSADLSKHALMVLSPEKMERMLENFTIPKGIPSESKVSFLVLFKNHEHLYRANFTADITHTISSDSVKQCVFLCETSARMYDEADKNEKLIETKFKEMGRTDYTPQLDQDNNIKI